MRAVVASALLALAACSGSATPATQPAAGAATGPGAMTWTQVDPDPSSDAGPVAVVGWNGGLLGVGSGLAWSSPDGRTWTPAPEPLADAWGLTDIIAVDGRAIAVGQAASTATVWTTTDGATWTPSADPDLAAVAPYTYTSIARIVAGPGGMVAVGTENGEAGQRPVAWWSADGVDWVRSTEPLTGNGLRSAATDGTAWVGVGAATVPANDLTKAAFWQSRDGQSWVELPDDGTRMRVEPQAVAWTGDRYVAVGYAGILTGNGAAFRPQAWLSDDGAAWSLAEPSADTSIWPFPGATPVANEGALWGGMMMDVVALGGGLLAVGSYWGLDPSIANEDGMHMSFGSRGVAWTSMDGSSWALGPDALFTAPATGGADGAGTMQYALGRVAVVDGQPIVTGVVPGAGSVLWTGSAEP